MLYRFRLQDSVKAYEQAIKEDDQFANAYAMLGKAFVVLSAFNFLPPVEGYKKAWQLGNKAIDIDPRQADGYNTLGFVSMLHQWNFRAARNYFETVLKIDPFNAYGHIGLAWYYCVTQQFDKSEEFGRSASRLDPLNQDILFQKGMLNIYGGQFELGKETANRIIEIDPSTSEGHRLLGWAYFANKEYDLALRAYQKAFELDPNSGWAKTQLAIDLVMTGNKTEAEKFLEEMLEQSSSNWWSANSIAWVYAALGNRDQAFYWLEKALEDRAENFLFMFETSFWGMVRNDPRFEELQKRADALKVI